MQYFCGVAVLASMRHIDVVAAVIHDAAGRIFATQRGYGDMKGGWEFPGGKIEPGETPEEALLREIAEELEAQITIERHLRTVEWDYPQFHITLRCYLCTLADEHIALREHAAARWLAPVDLDSVAWLPADKEVVAAIAHYSCVIGCL